MKQDEAHEEIRAGVSDDRLRAILGELWDEAFEEGSYSGHYASMEP